jgi:hypothetical protein
MPLHILNVSDGDTKVTFDKDVPLDCERASRIVTDMLRRGYAIMVQVGEKDGRPIFQRAINFDSTTQEYIVMGLSDIEEKDIAAKLEIEVQPARKAKAKYRGGSRKRVSSDVKAVSIGRSAGGCAREY